LVLSAAGIQGAENFWTLGFELQPNEKIFGLGETHGDLDRRGETILSDDPEHRALPLAWSPNGWGVYINSLGRVEHDLGSENADEYAIALEDATLDFFLFAGEPAEILNQYTQLTGRAGQPALWSMGVWVEQPLGHSATQTAEMIADFRAQHVAVDGVLMLPPAAWTYQDSKLLPDWDSERFPDPKQIMGVFGKHAVHLCLHTIPASLAGTTNFTELEDRGWLLANESGDAHVFEGVIATGGKQVRVAEGQQVHVELLGLEQGAAVDFTPVLVVDGSTVLATPTQLAGSKVSGRIVGSASGPKINGFVYKRRTNQRRRYGHRQHYQVVEITSIVKG
jgi:ribosomal protein L21